MVSFMHIVRYSPDPVIIMYLFAAMLELPLVQQYVYSRYSDDKGFPYDYQRRSTSCDPGKMNATEKTLQEQVQKLSARFNIAHSFCQTVPSVVAMMFYGVLSDKIGRRSIMIISAAGAFIDGLLVLLTMVLELPVYVLYIGGFFNGLAGSFTGAFMIAFAYIADITEKEKLPGRLAILEAANFFGLFISSYVSGPFIQKYAFIPPQILVATCYFGSLLYVIIVLKESLNYKTMLAEEDKTASLDFRELRSQPKILWDVMTRQRPRRWIVFLAMGILILGFCFTIGVVQVINLYFLNRPFCWPAIDIGNFLGTQMLLLGIGTIIGVKVGLRFLPDLLVAALSILASIVGFIMLASARSKTLAYGSVAVRGFGALQTPIFRSYISRTVEASEQGAVFSALSAVEMIFVFIGNFVYNAAYTKLNSSGKADKFFYVPATLLLIPLTLVIIFWIRLRKESKHILVEDWKKINEVSSDDATS